MTSLEEFRDLINKKNKISDNLSVIVDGTELYINAQQLLDIIDSLIELNKKIVILCNVCKAKSEEQLER